MDLVEVCSPKAANVGFLAYSPLAAGALTGKYLNIDSEEAKKGRFGLFPGFMDRYNKSLSRVSFPRLMIYFFSRFLSQVDVTLNVGQAHEKKLSLTLLWPCRCLF